jgi:hypothetical protein
VAIVLLACGSAGTLPHPGVAAGVVDIIASSTGTNREGTTATALERLAA